AGRGPYDVHRLQGRRVHDGRVVQLDAGRRLHDVAHGGAQDYGDALAAAEALLGRLQSPGEGEGARARFRPQVDVAAAKGEAVGIADDGTADDLDVEEQVARQASDDLQLLEVLLAEIGPVRHGHAQQLGDHRGDAAEVPRPAGALPAVLQTFDFDERRRIRRVHL